MTLKVESAKNGYIVHATIDTYVAKTKEELKELLTEIVDDDK